MALEGFGRLQHPESSRTIIRITQKVATDSAFPFDETDRLLVRIDTRRRRLIIEFAPEDQPAEGRSARKKSSK